MSIGDFRFRVSPSDGEAFRSLAADAGLGQTDLFRLFCRHSGVCSDPPSADLPLCMDFTTTCDLIRAVRSVGTLYNQSVVALNTVAKFLRRCDADADDARIALERVDAEMGDVLEALHALRDSAATIAGRTVYLL